MARQKREISRTGIYHIILRGEDKLFLTIGDYEYFLELLKKYFQESKTLYAYCLMENHVHLLIYEAGENVCAAVKPLCTSYARYFNRQYKKNGKLFYDRYKSEGVEDNGKLLACIRFIHDNPKKLGVLDWKYSSETEYVTQNLICGVSVVFDSVGGQDAYSRYMSQNEIVMCLEDYNRMDNEEIAKYIHALCGVQPKEIKALSAEQRTLCIEKIKKDKWISNRRIAEILGFDRNVIDRTGKKEAVKAIPAIKKQSNQQERKGLDIWLL